jgi:hypothetical protein
MSPNPSEKTQQSVLSLYVVYHPKCKLAEELAGKLYEWFRLGYQTGDTGSVSVPFWIRSELNTQGGLKPDIRFDDASLNIVILLASHEMVLDSTWRKALLELQAEVASRQPPTPDRDAAAAPAANDQPTARVELLPTVLDDSFYNLTPIYENHNPLRLTDLTTEQQVGVLRRGVLEMTARTLQARQEKPGAASEMRVFLSHAKKDGKEIAEKLRDGIRQFGQLIPWYDANDLAISQGWAKTLNTAMDSTTAGMIAVVTDAYPTRPWCRKELQTARTPKEYPKESKQQVPGPRVFALQPVVAVMELGGTWTRGLATLEGVPRVGWSETNPLQAIEGIVDRLVLEMMLHHVRRQTALNMAARAQDPHTLFLTWVPDGWTLAQLAKLVSPSPTTGTSPPLTLVYPGVELSPAEKDDLDIQLRLFGSQTRLLSFQEWEELRPGQTVTSDAAATKATRPKLLIALSAGGDAKELARQGLRTEHVDEAMVRIVMRVLSAGHRVAFGGTFNNPDHPLTQKMVDTTLRWANLKDQTGDRDKSSKYLNDPSRWPVVNYSAYPYYNDLKPTQEAKWIGLCDIRRVEPEAVIAEEDRKIETETLKVRRDLAKLNADALSKMREVSTGASHLRIVWGGRIEKAMGWMPGIFEEVGCSLEHKKPLLILGALGGCARLIADFLGTQGSAWPEQLSLKSCADSSRDAWLTAAERKEHDARFARYAQLLMDYRDQLHNGQSTINNVSVDLLLSALRPDLGTSSLLSHVEQFIEQVAQSQAS